MALAEQKDLSAPTFESRFLQVTGRAPYPWQTRLYAALRQGGPIPPSIALPTGLGKTSVVALYLLALSDGAQLPTRLVYIVDRRTIVDQTAKVVGAWIERMSGLPECSIPLRERSGLDKAGPVVALGVLRGGMADSGAWRLDPSRPAVVIGTVDMVGSRLLFSGYGDGRSRRPLHAGLLGHDSCLLLDESHLSPALVPLLRDIVVRQKTSFRPPPHVITMSATPEQAEGFTVDDADRSHADLRRRLLAKKRLYLHEVEKAKRDRMVELLTGYRTGAVLAFVTRVEDAIGLSRALVRALGKDSASRVGLLTGTLRGHEREHLVQSSLWARFSPDRDRTDPAPVAYLISTSAGEVGVDLDADHLVMDLVPMDSVVQRLGRVNRAGVMAESEVHVVYAASETPAPAANGQDPAEPGDDDVEPGQDDDETGSDSKPSKDPLASARGVTLDILGRLTDVSPASLLELDPEELRRASTPQPCIVPLGAERLGLLTATSARLAPPNLEVWLRGLALRDDPPTTQVLWRRELRTLLGGTAGEAVLAAAEAALTVFPARPGEVLTERSDRVQNQLEKLVKRVRSLPCVIVGADGAVRVEVLSPDQRLPRLPYATLVLPTDVGGLTTDGIFDAEVDDPVLDVGDADDRVRFTRSESGPDMQLPDWLEHGIVLDVPVHDPGDEFATPLWLVYARRRADELALDADSDLSRLAVRAQTLQEHGEQVGLAARRLVEALQLTPEVADAVVTAARWHDAGKARTLWQRAAGNVGPPLAKAARGVLDPRRLGGFRHEFASLVDAERSLAKETAEERGWLRDLTLHLIAAHHGHARPGFIDARHWDPDLPADVAARIAEETEYRFAALQERLGPWTLAWLEALVKAADAWVSAGNRLETGQ